MRIHELTLYTPARYLAAMGEFYTHTLGLPRITTDDSSFTVSAGATQLTFAAADDSQTPQYHFAFNIPHNQYDSAYSWLGEKTPLLHDGQGRDQFRSSESWRARQFYFADPAGNIGELIARERLPAANDDTFTPDSILNVSEIGIAADDVEKTTAEMRAAYDLPYLGEHSDTFTPLGDDEGVFIVVKTERIWFPETGVPALQVPLTITFENNGERYKFSTPA